MTYGWAYIRDFIFKHVLSIRLRPKRMLSMRFKILKVPSSEMGPVEIRLIR